MTYRIARSGQTFGPYTDAEIRQYIASGNIGMSDMAIAEGSSEWVLVQHLFPLTTVPVPPPMVPVQGPSTLYADPPDFPWWAAMLLFFVTGGLFLVIWDIVEASWLKRLEKKSTAFLLYIGIAVLYLFKLPGMFSRMDFNVMAWGGHHHDGGGSLVFILAIAARFVFRRELLDHFNTREGIPLRLNGFWTFLFGGIYFQYHFNRINQLKREMNRSVPAV